MLKGAEHEYPLCLLDTSVVSAFVKDPSGSLLRNFYEWACRGDLPVVACFALHTVYELRRAPEVFRRFIEHFQVLPCVLLKPYAELLREEIAGYPNPREIEPDLLAFTFLGGTGNQLVNLPTMLETPALAEREAEWNAGAPEIVEGIVSLVDNYPPANGVSYSAGEVRHFVWQVSLGQLYFHDREFTTDLNDRDIEIDIGAFPTLKSMAYSVFYKFYADRDRNPLHSDAFDVVIAGALPYVEAVITEAHGAEGLRKTKRVDPFLDELQVFTVRDFRDSP